MTTPEAGKKLAHFAAGLLILIASAQVAGRIATVTRLAEPALLRDAKTPGLSPAWPVSRPAPSPFMSSNDRSRWATVRSLVEDGTYIVGVRDKQTVILSALLPLFQTDPGTALGSAGVAHRLRLGADSGFLLTEDAWRSVDRVLNPATLEYQSSKPPLLPTLVAGLVKPLQWMFGWKPSTHPFEMARVVLLLINWLPWTLYLLVFWRLLQLLPASDFARLVTLALAAFATLVQPYLVVFNNHTPGTFCALFLLHALAMERTSRQSGSWLWLVWAGLVAGFGVTCEMPALCLAAMAGLGLLIRSPGKAIGLYCVACLVPLVVAAEMNRYVTGRYTPVYSEFGSPWYEYEGSSWYDPGHLKRGIDWARRNLGETKPAYAFHLLAGHHGLFSLTPVFLLALPGAWLAHKKQDSGEASRLQWRFAWIALACTVVVTAFYLVKSDNYGGNCCSARWLQWLTPLLLLAALPAVEWLCTTRKGLALLGALVFFSVVSAASSAYSPWRRPWLYDIMVWAGWPGYD
ncbi:MAG: hypothetical protein NTV55_11185 [Planctomycetota bacterium]|nr:hypothetical protein [Planctomycetota bacterium]